MTRGEISYKCYGYTKSPGPDWKKWLSNWLISREWLHFLISQEAHHLGSRIAAICQSGKFPGGLSENRVFHSIIFHPMVNHDFPHDVCHVFDVNASICESVCVCIYIYIGRFQSRMFLDTSRSPLLTSRTAYTCHACACWMPWWQVPGCNRARWMIPAGWPWKIPSINGELRVPPCQETSKGIPCWGCTQRKSGGALGFGRMNFSWVSRVCNSQPSAGGGKSLESPQQLSASAMWKNRGVHWIIHGRWTACKFALTKTIIIQQLSTDVNRLTSLLPNWYHVSAT